ncbi:MAG: bifunctional nuclease family protein [Chloroflexi bacterium]|nr:bifunctional nuclease family protein [Chloroflexota bacterium]
MVEVTVESIRVSLINQNRLVVLREKRSPRYLSIWIGAFEADAITVGLQDDEVPRPLTHDLICNILTQLGAELEQIEILDMRDDTFFAELVLRTEAGEVRIDTRPSDAIAIAVRRAVPIYVSTEVMDRLGQLPAPDVESDEAAEGSVTPSPTEEASDLNLFRDFVDSLDLSDLGGDEDGQA